MASACLGGMGLLSRAWAGGAAPAQTAPIHIQIFIFLKCSSRARGWQTRAYRHPHRMGRAPFLVSPRAVGEHVALARGCHEPKLQQRAGATAAGSSTAIKRAWLGQTRSIQPGVLPQVSLAWQIGLGLTGAATDALEEER